MSEDGSDRSLNNLKQSVALELGELSSSPSNKNLLCIAFVSFQSFAIIQLGAAILAGSQAMLGDSVAMMVDALTYLFNLVAVRQKDLYASKLKQRINSSQSMASSERSRLILEYRKYTYQLELIPPLLSVSTLLVVTFLVLKESIHTLILDSQRDNSLQSDPNVDLMVIFSVLNLVLDVVNVGCFASASHALGYRTDNGARDQIGADSINTVATDTVQESFLTENNGKIDFDNDVDSNTDSENNTKDRENDEPLGIVHFDEESVSSQLHHDDDRSTGSNIDDSANLNMCSAYTHVFADTMRSFAVILASLLAKFTNAVTPEVADATAAVIVSIFIFLSLFPLIGGMIRTFKSLKQVNGMLKTNESKEKEEELEIELLPLV
mmetsp:Transcript_24728/g.58060  ORF Transcript_24728/g.58060 Transcript_24728/m.58060 type:complete len:380 (+) Transcript_24728:226-1365(+)